MQSSILWSIYWISTVTISGQPKQSLHIFIECRTEKWWNRKEKKIVCDLIIIEFMCYVDHKWYINNEKKNAQKRRQRTEMPYVRACVHYCIERHCRADTFEIVGDKSRIFHRTALTNCNKTAVNRAKKEETNKNKCRNDRSHCRIV